MKRPEKPKRAKRPRVIAPPQHLATKAELTGHYAPVPRPESLRQFAASRPAGTEGATRDARDGNPLDELRAKDDDPRRWGDTTEDLGEAMKRDKPPHW